MLCVGKIRGFWAGFAKVEGGFLNVNLQYSSRK